MFESLSRILLFTVPLVTTMGVLSAAHAVMRVRSPRGVIAWAIALVAMPYFALPLYWVFGRYRFMGYVAARRSGDDEISHIAREAFDQTRQHETPSPDTFTDTSALDIRLTGWPLTGGNDIHLLINGHDAFAAMYRAIDDATDYILMQFFIVRDDRLGRDMQQRLIERARSGIRVYFLYDEIGSHQLSKSYVRKMTEAGVQVTAFRSSHAPWSRLQVNFRNHRKITIVDGRVAFVGGLNLGDEYVGRSKRFGPWRDTHAEVRGPAILPIQMAFLQDWNFCTHDTPDLCWVPETAGNQKALVAATGPADELENCHLLYLRAINAARHRLWIASPYFVPDHSIVAALQLAALRGVDVRIILPQKPDHYLVYLSAFSYLSEMLSVDVKLYRYQPGFMHQKVMLMDDTVASVGTVNLDNRSLYLNFELSLIVVDERFHRQVRAMFEEDFSNSTLMTQSEHDERPLWFKIAVRIARIMSPIQ